MYLSLSLDNSFQPRSAGAALSMSWSILPSLSPHNKSHIFVKHAGKILFTFANGHISLLTQKFYICKKKSGKKNVMR